MSMSVLVRKNIIKVLKLNSIILNVEVEEKICDHLTNRFTDENVARFYQAVKLHKYSGPTNFFLRYLELCFTLVADSCNFIKLKIKDFKRINFHLVGQRYSSVVSTEEETFVFGGRDAKRKQIMQVEKYSPATNSWKRVADMYDDRKYFSFCCLGDSVYIIGGLYNGTTLTDTCIEFNTKYYKYNEVASMNEERTRAASANFQGRIVVSGGWNDVTLMNTVEAYDRVTDTWSYMPDMIEERCWHSSIPVGNKLFMIGGARTASCEVYDTFNKIFVALSDAPQLLHRHSQHSYFSPVKTFLIGSKIFIVGYGSTAVACYDVDKEEWSENSCKTGINLSSFLCESKNLNLI